MSIIYYFFINAEGHNLGGITTIGNYLEKHDSKCIHIKLEDSIKHSPEKIIKKISELIFLKKLEKEKIVLIPNIGESVHSACLKYAYSKENIRILCICHNNQRNTYELFQKIEKNISLFLCVSEGCSKNLKKYILQRSDDINTAYPTIPTSLSSSFLANKKKHVQIVYCGRLNHRDKGILHLSTIATYLKNLNIKFRLNIIGSGPDKEFLEKSLISQNINFYFFGQLSQIKVESILKNQDFILQTSSDEGFGLSIFCAMQFGVIPVLMRTSTGLSSLLEDKSNAIIENSGEYEKLSLRLYEAIKNYNYLIKLKKNAKNFSINFLKENNFLDKIKKSNEKIFQIPKPQEQSLSLGPIDLKIKKQLAEIQRKKIINLGIFGAGNYGKRLADTLQKKKIQPAFIVDSFSKINNYKDIPIINPNNISNYHADAIIIGSLEFADEMIKILRLSSHKFYKEIIN